MASRIPIVKVVVLKSLLYNGRELQILESSAELPAYLGLIPYS